MADAGVYSRNLFDLLDDENQDASAQAAVAKPAKDAKKDAKAAPAAAAPAKKDDTRLVASSSLHTLDCTPEARCTRAGRVRRAPAFSSWPAAWRPSLARDNGSIADGR
jgi:hypothetical protein